MSTWNQNHIIGFRMLDFHDLPIHYLYPQSYCPSTNDPVITEMGRLFTLSQEVGETDRVKTGSAFSFYRTLQDCLRTQQKTLSPTQIPTRPQRYSQPRVPIHQYVVSDSSMSSFVSTIASMDG